MTYEYKAASIGLMKEVKGPTDIPDGEHLTVLIYKTSTQHVPGDERSRTHPGHGYPAHNVTHHHTEHWVTKNKDALLAFVEAIQEDDDAPPFVVMTAKKATVRVQTVIDITS